MDTQIWYAIFSTIFGGIYGAFRRLGEVGAFFLRPTRRINFSSSLFFLNLTHESVTSCVFRFGLW